MKKTTAFVRRSLFALSVLLSLSVVSALAQATAFTYQGRFTDSTAAQPTNGTYDFQFTLFDGDGNAVAAPVLRDDAVVSNGVFTVTLDFGAVFDGTARTLEIGVRPGASTGAFTTLTPRQPITSTPYAIRALNAANATNAASATNAENLTGNLSGDVSGTQNATVVNAVGGQTAANVAGATADVLAATDANTAGALVRRSAATGGFTAGAASIANNRLTVTVPDDSAEGLQIVNPQPNSYTLNNLLLRMRSSSGDSTFLTDKFRFDNGGGFVAIGQLGYGLIPASGEGVRFMWHPYKGSFRFGAASLAGEFDEGNIGFYSFAGGNRTIANDFASFAFGDQVTVTGSNAVGFGGASTVDGNFGFSSGSQNICVGFVCTAIGFQANANGQGAFALGYQTTADADYSFALGRMANTNGHTGAFVWGDASINDVVRASANNQFTIRARGGIRLRTSTATSSTVGVNANTGCDIPGNSGVMSCASSRFVKENYLSLEGEEVLLKLRRMPVMQWNYIGDESGEKHIGPFAEDFQSAFRLSPTDKSIGMQDLAGVSLVGVQALERRTTVLQNENEQLKSRLEEQQRHIEELKKIVCAIKPDADVCRQPDGGREQ